MNRLLLCLSLSVLTCTSMLSQEVKQLVPDGETIKVIGSLYSVDYDTDTASISETKNTRFEVFDGLLNTFFSSWERSYTWVGLDLGAQYVITKIAYCPRRHNPDRLQLGVFEGANQPDFGDAVPLFIIKDVPEENVMTEQVVINTRGYRYVRYVSPSEKRCNIAEIAFFGYQGVGNETKLFQTTNIPDVIIHTENAEEVTSKETYIKGIISFISDDGTNFYRDSLEIKGRGNASWTFPKKPYRLKLNTSTRIFDLPAKARNWTLINNYGDKTLIRNVLAFDISRRFEMPYTPACKLVNVYFNGEYKGCYQFCDHIDIRQYRVDIDEIQPADTVGESLTGGYLLEMDARATQEEIYYYSNSAPFVIKKPDFEEMLDPNHPCRLYIKDITDKFVNNAYSRNPVFRNYLDINTFMKHFLINELSGNPDSYWSVFYYKKRNDDKLYTGPVWDFDLAFENDRRIYPINDKADWAWIVSGSIANSVVKNTVYNITKALNDDIAQLWIQKRNDGSITEENFMAVIDSCVEEIAESQSLNFIRWNILNKKVHLNFQALGSYEAEIDVVREYIRERIRWIDRKTGFDSSNEQVNRRNIKLWSQNSRINIEGIDRPVLIEMTDITGRTLGSIAADGNISVPCKRGFMIIRISDKRNSSLQGSFDDSKVYKIFNF